METLELKRPKNKIKTELCDEDGYSVASLEEGIADYKAGRVMRFVSREEFMEYIDREIANEI